MQFKSIFTIVACCAGMASAQFTSWGHFKDIYLNTSSTGANVATTQTNFPVLVRLTAAHTDVFTGSKGRGADVRFSKLNGTTRLPHQIEKWDSAGKSALIWVLADSVLGNTAGQRIRMYWDKTAEADSSKGSAVFAASNGYVGVYHLNETAGTAAAVNSTNSALPLDVYLDAVDPTAALIGGGRHFNGANLGTYEALQSADNAFNPTTAVTASVWFKAASTSNNNRIFQRTRTDPTFRFMFTGSDGEFSFGASAEGYISEVVPTVIGNWHLLHATISSTERNVYIDGALLLTEPRSGALNLGPNDTQDGFFLAAKPNSATSSNYFDGDMDEFRFSNVARSAGWAKLEYETQKASTTTVGIGATDVSTGIVHSSASAKTAFSAQAVGNGYAFRFADVSNARVSIADMRGRMVWSRESKGASELLWNGATTVGQKASRGTYFVRMDALKDGKSVSAEKVIVLH